jgi:hypothetical protein
MTAVAAVTDGTRPGSEFPLAATGTNFAVASGAASPASGRPGLWLPGHGSVRSGRGVRCHLARLLLDPYARAVTGTVTFGPEVLGYSGSVQEVPNEADSAPCVPRSVVVADELFGWRDGARRGYTYAETIIYEVHVDGYRFDLVPTLARQEGEFGTRSAFFDLVAQDPVWWPAFRDGADRPASGDPIAESPVEGDDSCGRNTSAWRPEEAEHDSPRSTGAWLDGSSAAPAVPHRGRRAGRLHRPVRIDLLLLRR